MQHNIFLINFIILGQYISVVTSFILCSLPKSKRHAYEISTEIVPLEPHQCYFLFNFVLSAIPTSWPYKCFWWETGFRMWGKWNTELWHFSLDTVNMECTVHGHLNSNKKNIFFLPNPMHRVTKYVIFVFAWFNFVSVFRKWKLSWNMLDEFWKDHLVKSLDTTFLRKLCLLFAGKSLEDIACSKCCFSVFKCVIW